MTAYLLKMLISLFSVSFSCVGELGVMALSPEHTSLAPRRSSAELLYYLKLRELFEGDFVAGVG